MMIRILMLLVLFLAFALGGCSITKPDVATWDAQIAAQNSQRLACENRKATAAVQEASMVARLAPTAQAVYMATKNQAAAIAAATGHDYDSCGTGATINDVLIAEVRSKNETLASVVGSIGNATIITTGIIEAGKVARAGIENAGSKTNLIGDANTVRVQDSRTNTTTSSTATAVTGDSSAGAGSPSVSGAPTTTETSQNGVVPEGSTLAGAPAAEPIVVEEVAR